MTSRYNLHNSDSRGPADFIYSGHYSTSTEPTCELSKTTNFPAFFYFDIHENYLRRLLLYLFLVEIPLFCDEKSVTIQGTSAGFTVAIETFPTRYRGEAGILCQVPWMLSMLLLDLLAYFIRDWHQLQLIAAILPLFLLPCHL